MLATFVIGLREGLEAALIIGIIAAFLKQNNRADALRKMWTGVGVAIALCLGVGILLQRINSALPQRQQEMLECVVAAVAVVMVSYMVLWMRAHSRSLKSDLHKAAGGALANGSATAFVVMAFLAVFREGFETAVFLLAAFQSAVSPAQAVAGSVLGVLIAVALGYFIYRGGVKLNLSRFFRITGVVLVLVAAGLVMSTLRAAHEAGWLTVGQQHAVSLSLIARPGTVQESLLTGVLGVRSSMPVIEVVAYFLYLLPMLAVVLWPARAALIGRTLGRVLAGSALSALVIAGIFALLAPAVQSAPKSNLVLQSTVSESHSIAGGQVAAPADPGAVTVVISAGGGSAVFTGAISGMTTLLSSGHAQPVGLPTAVYTGTSITVPVRSATLPAGLTLKQVAAFAGGRLPIGLSISGDLATVVLPASYTDSFTPTISVDPTTSTVIDLSVVAVRSVTVTNANGSSFELGTLTSADLTATSDAISKQVLAARAAAQASGDHQVLGEVVPGLLIIFALILLGFGAPLLWRRPRQVTPQLRDTEHEKVEPLPAVVGSSARPPS